VRAAARKGTTKSKGELVLWSCGPLPALSLLQHHIPIPTSNHVFTGENDDYNNAVNDDGVKTTKTTMIQMYTVDYLYTR